MKRLLLFVAISLSLPTFLHADHPELLDAVPRNVRGSLSIHNLEQFQKKGTQLLKDLNRQRTFELGQLYEVGMNYLGITKGIDRTGTFSIILADWGTEKPANRLEWDYLLVRVPYSDADEMASNFKLPKGSLAPGIIHTVRSNLRANEDSFLGSDEHAIYLGMREDAVQSVLDAGKLSDANIVDDERRIADSDILLHLHISPFRNDPDSDLKEDLLRVLNENVADENFRKVAAELVDSSENLLFSGTIDKGAHFRTQLTFGKNLSDATRKQLADWTAGETAPTLNSLPDGHVFLSAARSRNRAGSSDVSQLIAQWLVLQPWGSNTPLQRAQELFNTAQETLLGVFEELYSGLNQVRSGVYLNQNTGEHGLVTVISIAEPSSAKEFDQTLQDVLKYARGTNYNPVTKAETKITAAEIEELIKQLGADQFRTRKAATLKLKLLGEPAVPALKEAAESLDAEVRNRSQKILDEIQKSLEVRQAELARRNLRNLPLPTFVMYPAHTEIEGYKVDLIEARWADADENTLAEIKSVLGPNAREILLAHVGEQLVICIGSNRDLLKQTLLNLKGKNPGLEDRTKLFRGYDSAKRNAEMHFSLQKLKQMFPESFPTWRSNRDETGPPTEAVSSVDVEIAPTHLIADFTFPVDELKILNSLFGIW